MNSIYAETVVRGLVYHRFCFRHCIPTPSSRHSRILAKLVEEYPGKKRAKRLEIKQYHEQLAKEQKDKEERRRLHEQETAQAWGEKVASIILEHKEALRHEKRRYESVDAYGNVDDGSWYDTTKLSLVLEYMNGYNDISMLSASIQAGHADSGFLYFWRHVILLRFGSLENFIDGWQAAQRVYPDLANAKEGLDNPRMGLLAG
jgi:hypothetical protein